VCMCGVRLTGVTGSGERGVDLALGSVPALPAEYVGVLAGFEFLVDVEEVADLGAHELRDVLQFAHVRVTRVAGGHGEDLGVGPVFVVHPEHPDRTSVDAAAIVTSSHTSVVTELPVTARTHTLGEAVDGVIFHSDRGSEYTAAKTAAACRALGVTQSMGRVGCALDNAAAEAFNSTRKVEFAHRHTFTGRAEARIKISTWIADFYNATRRHTTNDGLAPFTFERQMAQKRRASTAQLRTKVA